MPKRPLRKAVLLLVFLQWCLVWAFHSSAQPFSTCAMVGKTNSKSLLSHDNKRSQSDERNEEAIAFWQKRVEEKIASGDIVIQIPVVVHVVHNDPSSSPNPNQSSHISINQIFSQIRVLNEDFRRKANSNGYNTSPIGADVGIEFCLASTDPNGAKSNGVNFIYNNRGAWNTSAEDEKELKALSYWPSDKYLNIWVTNLEVEKGFGYARYPFGTGLDDFYPDIDYGAELDGVVIDYRVFGTTGAAVYPYNLGRTATHEVGHWLGLKHIWGDELCGNDFVDDTPMDQSPNNDSDCSDSSFCSDSYVNDHTNNYLDFSPDRCMNMFTLGQKARMLGALVTSPRRRGLFESRGCSDFSQKLYANMYPNPSSDELFIDLYWPGHQSVQIEMYNSQGGLVMSKEVETDKASKLAINVSVWPTGIYFMKIRNKDNNDSESRRFFKLLIEH